MARSLRGSLKRTGDVLVTVLSLVTGWPINGINLLPMASCPTPHSCVTQHKLLTEC